MLASMMGEPRPPKSLVQRMVQESEGNPLFVEETLKALVEQGKLVRSPEGWRIPSGGKHERHEGKEADTRLQIELPPSIRGVVMQRVERLSPEARATLASAAVLGRDFSFDLLLALTGKEEDALLDIIDELLQHGVIVEPRGEEERYAFFHEKLREILYDTLHHRKRRRLHRKAAEAIEALGKSDQYEIVARHFLEARLEARALPYLLRAAHRFRKSYNNAAAIACYTQALEICRKGSTDLANEDLAGMEMEILKCRGEVRELIGEYREAMEDGLALYEKAVTQGDRKHEALGKVLQGSVSLAQGNLARAETLTLEAIVLFTECGDHTGVVRSLNRLADIRALEHRNEEALATYRDALRRARKIGNGEKTAYALISIANVLIDESSIEEAMTVVREAIEVARACGYRKGVARGMNTLARAFTRQGDYRRAREYFHASLALKEEIGDRLGALVTSSNLGCIAHIHGRSNDAIERFRASMKILQETGAFWAEALLQANLGNVFVDLGAFDLAEKALEKSMELARNDDFLLGDIHLHLGELRCHTGEREACREAFRAAQRLAETAQRNDADLIARASLLLQGISLTPENTLDEEEERLIGRARKEGEPFLLAKVALLLAQRHFPPFSSTAPLREEAWRRLEEARGIAEQHDFAFLLWKALALEARLYEIKGEGGAQVLRARALEVIHDIADHAGAWRERFLDHPEIPKLLPHFRPVEAPAP